MSKSTTTGRTASAARGTGGNSKPTTESSQVKPHLVIPVADFGSDDDEDEDNFQPRRGFTPKPVAATPPATAVVPAQASETVEEVRSAVSQVTEAGPRSGPADEAASPEAAAPSEIIVAKASPLPSATDDAAAPVPAPTEIIAVEVTSNLTPSGQPMLAASPLEEPVAEAQVDQGADTPSSFAGAGTVAVVERPTNGVPPGESAQAEAPERSLAVPAWGQSSNAPAVRTVGSVTAVPARRPGPRRRPAEPFNAEQPRQRNQEAGQELAQRAPRYASLLAVYSASQLATLSFESRNINLVGLLADQVGVQIAADKALLKKLTSQRPKLTIAHYVDAALEPVLRPLDPEGTDLDKLDEERDYVWELARRGNAYRGYIKTDQDSATLSHYRAKGSLRADVNARLSRLIDLMDSMQGIPAKPYEIICACLDEYLTGLATEREAVTEVFKKYTEVTTIQ